jgi:hypothetical protein
MAEFNIFELVPTLTFDPPENKKKAEVKIKKRIEEIEILLRNETDSGKRKKLEDEKSVLNALALTEEKLKNDAEETKKKAVASLEATIAAIKMGSKNREVTEGQINAYKKQTRLDKDSIKKVFTGQGFTITPMNTGKLPPLISDQDIRLIQDNINIIKTDKHGEKDLENNEREKIEDLFWFIAYINKDISNGKSYPSKTREELYKILADNKNSFSTRIDELGHALLDLCSIGSTKVFDGDEHLKAYRNSLRYMQLTEVFKIIKNAPESVRKTAALAEPLIAQIQKHFPVLEESLAIYNKEAGLQNDPYEQEQVSLTISCGACGHTQKFSGLGEAKGAKCSACGAAFYRPCPKCGELVPSSAEYCPQENCGFFIAGIKNFSRYYNEAAGALERFDITEAQKNFGRAKSANPNEPRLPALEQRIKQAAAEYERPLKEIQDLIYQKKLRTAQSKIKYLYSQRPALNLSSFEDQIKTKLAEADRLFAAASSGPPAEKAKVCIKILNFCEDYSEALSYLESSPPAPCPALTIKPDATAGACAVSWYPSPDEGIKYTLIRKLGNIPANVHDGQQLFDGQVLLDYQDKDIEPGRRYGYAVFAKRYGTVSKGTGAVVVLYSEISALRCETGETTCSLTWALPKNCIGVRVSRKEGGTPVPGERIPVVSEKAQRGFEDSSLASGSRYGYRLEALYQEDQGIVSSSGVTCSVFPERKPLAVRISVKQEGDNCRFSWQPVQNGFDLRFVCLTSGASIREGQVYKDAEIHGFGTVIASERSDRGATVVSVNLETCFEAACFVTFSNSGIASNTLLVNTFKPCEIDGKPKLDNSALRLSLKTPLPSGVRNIYYIARRKQREKNPPPWAGAEDAADMASISAESYLKAKEIVIPGITEAGDYYITLLTGYQMGGRTVYADPVRKRFSNTVPGRINWGIKRSLFKGFELVVEFTASETVMLLPALSLCYSETGGYLNSAKDKSAQIFYTSPEQQYRPRERITRTFPVNGSDMERMPKGRSFILFVADEDLFDDYRIGFIDKFSGTL